jgi:ferritin
MNEERFLTWFIANQSDLEEARADIEEIIDKLNRRLRLTDDSPQQELLHEYLFNGYEPL